MTSARKCRANRLNSRKSTGPRSIEGKARSRTNARRHGLAISPLNDAQHIAKIGALAACIAGSNNSMGAAVDARDAAEATVELIAVRETRARLFAGIAINYDGADGASSKGEASFQTKIDEILDRLLNIDRYERRALSRRKKSLRRLRT